MMYRTTSRKIVAYGNDEYGDPRQVADKLSKEEYDLLCAVLTKARRTCKCKLDWLSYAPRVERIIKLIENLEFD
jgi:hypothetical protein